MDYLDRIMATKIKLLEDALAETENKLEEEKTRADSLDCIVGYIVKKHHGNYLEVDAKAVVDAMTNTDYVIVQKGGTVIVEVRDTTVH